MLSFEFLLRLSAILKLDFLKSPGKSGSARPPRGMKLGNSRPFWITSFGFVKVYRIRFSYLGKLHWFLYLLLSYYHDPDMFIFCWSSNFMEKVVLNESMAAKMASRVSCLVYYNFI